MKKVLSIVLGILEFLVIIYIIFITSCILCINKFGFTQFGNYTLVTIDNLRSKYLEESKKGDLIITEYSEDISNGDKIYYYESLTKNYIVKSSKVDEILKGGDQNLYTVEIDGKKESIPDTRVLGIKKNKYHNLGGILSFLKSRIGFLIFVLVPIMFIFIYQIYELVIVIRYDKEDEDDEDKKNKKEIEEL